VCKSGTPLGLGRTDEAVAAARAGPVNSVSGDARLVPDRYQANLTLCQIAKSLFD